ncbi:MAG: hypothetical protein ACK56I_28975, partial [bacterium]
PAGQQPHEGAGHGLAGADERVVALRGRRRATHLRQERGEGLQVAGPQGTRIAGQPLGQLQPLEPGRALEREVDLVVVEHVKQQRVGAALGAVPQAGCLAG